MTTDLASPNGNHMIDTLAPRRDLFEDSEKRQEIADIEGASGLKGDKR